MSCVSAGRGALSLLSLSLYELCVCVSGWVSWHGHNGFQTLLYQDLLSQMVRRRHSLPRILCVFRLLSKAVFEKTMPCDSFSSVWEDFSGQEREGGKERGLLPG